MWKQHELHLQRDQHKLCGNHGNSRLYLNHNADFKRIRETFQRTIKHHADPFSNIINLSKHEFSIPEYKLLGKNLNFCPTPGIYSKEIVTKETNEFFRPTLGTTKTTKLQKKIYSNHKVIGNLNKFTIQ